MVVSVMMANICSVTHSTAPSCVHTHPGEYHGVIIRGEAGDTEPFHAEPHQNGDGTQEETCDGRVLGRVVPCHGIAVLGNESNDGCFPHPGRAGNFKTSIYKEKYRRVQQGTLRGKVTGAICAGPLSPRDLCLCFSAVSFSSFRPFFTRSDQSYFPVLPRVTRPSI